jgi:hypothetical protein
VDVGALRQFAQRSGRPKLKRAVDVIETIIKEDKWTELIPYAERKLPGNWRSDSISRFIDDAFMNSVATMTNLRKLPIVQILIEVNDLFLRANGIKCHPTREFLLPLFLGRSHSAYLAAVRLATSGQVVETYMVARGCLENALYGLFIQDDPTIGNPIPDRMKIWAERADSEDANRKCRNMFTFTNVIKNLASHDVKLHNRVNCLYDIAIDRGAHPNAMGHLMTSNVSVDGGHVGFLIPATELTCKSCIQATVQAGICALATIGLAYGTKFEDAGMSAQLQKYEGLFSKL